LSVPGSSEEGRFNTEDQQTREGGGSSSKEIKKPQKMRVENPGKNKNVTTQNKGDDAPQKSGMWYIKRRSAPVQRKKRW